jgi:hypothetical protein
VKGVIAVGKQLGCQEDATRTAADDHHMWRGIPGHKFLLACHGNENAGESAQDYN